MIGQPAAAEHLGTAAGRVHAPNEYVVGLVPAGVHEPIEHGPVDIEVAAEDGRQRVRPAQEAVRGALRIAQQTAPMEVGHPHAGMVEAHGMNPAPLRPHAQPVPPVLDDRVPAHEDRVGAAAVRLDQIGPANGDCSPNREGKVP